MLVRHLLSRTRAAIAQSVERLICNQQVGSSILSGGSSSSRAWSVPCRSTRVRPRNNGYLGFSDAGSVHSRIGVRRIPAARARAFFVPSLATWGASATSILTSFPIPPSAFRISWRCSRNRGRSASSVMDSRSRVPAPGPKSLRWTGNPRHNPGALRSEMRFPRGTHRFHGPPAPTKGQTASNQIQYAGRPDGPLARWRAGGPQHPHRLYRSSGRLNIRDTHEYVDGTTPALAP